MTGLRLKLNLDKPDGSMFPQQVALLEPDLKAGSGGSAPARHH